ncbi:uncharacterized protein JCM6883_000599 [Sporobolomyces salmoneus]|uniref:uncharacterized protein n=1 Tax=Sporobolomyces salmoneus TaxID=183962 RepID=UPI0031714D1E
MARLPSTRNVREISYLKTHCPILWRDVCEAIARPEVVRKIPDSVPVISESTEAWTHLTLPSETGQSSDGLTADEWRYEGATEAEKEMRQKARFLFATTLIMYCIHGSAASPPRELVDEMNKLGGPFERKPARRPGWFEIRRIHQVTHANSLRQSPNLSLRQHSIYFPRGV